MSVAYRVLYALGVTPWERMGASPAIRAQIASLFERQEDGHRPPYGPALDLGCGSGIWAFELARRGWDVTAVDNVPKALRRARERAREERVEPRFVHGDVTALGDADIGSGYRLLVDFGCFHDELTEEQRAAEGRGASAAAAPDATLLLMAWKPGRRGILPRGASPEEIEAAFPGWEIVAEEPMDVTDAPGWVRRGEPRFYTLRR